jgi:hypothetical protein
MKLTKQQLRTIILEELSPGEKRTVDMEVAQGPNMGLNPAIRRAIEILASTYVRVNAWRSDELFVQTVAERLIDGIEALISDLEDEFDE